MINRPPLHDFSRSRAVVMGTWDYTDPALESVPAVRHSYDRMVSMLTGPLCGWPSNRLLQLENEEGPGSLPYRLISGFEAAGDVALFYYVGHGLMDPDDQLCLGLGGSRYQPDHREATSLPFQAVRKALIKSPARTKIVILDCCFSGLAGQRANTLAAGELDPAAGAGAYTMMASEAFNTAWYETGSSAGQLQTYFTKYLVDLIEAGLPGEPDKLPLHTLFGRLCENLTRDELPAPAVRNVNAAHEFPFAYNAASLRSRGGPERTYRQFTGHDSQVLPADRPAVGRFLPIPIDEMAARRMIEGLVRGLPGDPGGNRSGSLDGLIDALAAEWVADVREQHARYVADLSPAVQTAEAEAKRAEAFAAALAEMLRQVIRR